MNWWLERWRQKNVKQNRPTREKFYSRFIMLVVSMFFLSAVTYGAGSVYWIVKKDNELEKSRRIELELRNNIKERDFQIQQFRQQIKQLERRVEILDAIQELSHADVSEEDQRRIARLVDENSEKYGHDPFLILALMATESSIRPWATSGTGANGLMQIMPSTGRYLTTQVKNSPKIIGADGEDDFQLPHYRDLEGNIELGTLYLTQLLLRYQNLEHAIYAYNLGPNLFEKRLETGGPFPKKYLAKVMRKYTELTHKYRDDENQVASALYSSNDLNHLLALADIPSHP